MASLDWCCFGGPGGCDRVATAPIQVLPLCDLHRRIVNPEPPSLVPSPLAVEAAEVVALLGECITDWGDPRRKRLLVLATHLYTREQIAERIDRAIDLIGRLTA